MPKLADRCQETTTTTGTGTFALNGAVTGYVTFGNSFSNGDVVWYVCDTGAGDWEIGYGTYSSNTLTRTVFQSSNANALVPFTAGAKRIFNTAPYTYLLPDMSSNSGKFLTTNGTVASWADAGTVTSVSVVSANGFAGTSSGGATPALTLSTNVNGIAKGNGTALTAATAGTDYAPATSGTAILKGNGAGGFSSASSGTDYAPATSGTAILKGNGSGGFSSASAGTDYAAANASFTLGSTSVSLGGTTTTVAGLTLTNPTINGFTGDTSVINVGSGQLYKDTSGNVGIGTSSPNAKIEVNGNAILGQEIYRSSATSILRIAGGSAAATGAGISLFGESHASLANVTTFFSGGAEKMRLDSSGNLGLGVTPSAWNTGAKAFELKGAGNALNSRGTTTEITQNAYFGVSGYAYGGTGQSTLYQQYAGQHLFFNAPSGTAGNAISFTQAMTLDASGNLGIGVTSPASKLDVLSTVVGVMKFTASGAKSGWLYSDSAGIAISDTADLSKNGLYINNTSNYVAVYTGSTGAERARIDSSGNLLVGDTASTSVRLTLKPVGTSYSNGAIKLIGAVSGANYITCSGGVFYVSNDGTTDSLILSAGNLTISGATATKASGTTWANPSDTRLKDNQQLYTKGLDELSQIVVKTWEFNGKGGSSKGAKGLGVIADEIESILPESVDTYKAKLNDDEDETDIKRFDASEIIWLLVNSVKELSAELNELKQRIN